MGDGGWREWNPTRPSAAQPSSVRRSNAAIEKKKVWSPKKKHSLSSRPFRFAFLSSLLLPQPTCTLRHVTSAHRSASIQPSGWPVESISLCLNYSSWPGFSHGSFASCILYARTPAHAYGAHARFVPDPTHPTSSEAGDVSWLSVHPDTHTRQPQRRRRRKSAISGSLPRLPDRQVPLSLCPCVCYPVPLPVRASSHRVIHTTVSLTPKDQPAICRRLH